jgi:hypothetical protein
MAGDYDNIDIIEVHTYDAVFEGEEALDHLEEADQVFYSVTWGGETYYRWVGGPFESLSDVEDAIADSEDFYKELAS